MKVYTQTSPITIVKNSKTPSFWQNCISQSQQDSQENSPIDSPLSKNPDQAEKILQTKLAFEKMKAERMKNSPPPAIKEEVITSLRHAEFLGRRGNVMELFVGLHPSFTPHFDEESVITISLPKRNS